MLPPKHLRSVTSAGSNTSFVEFDRMSLTIAGTEPYLVEQAAREVPGVAFAEVTQSGGNVVLRVVLWQDAPREETAGLVELALKDSLDVDVAGGDVVIAGVAALPPDPSPTAGDLRVIDLGKNTWATETIGAIGIPSLPDAPAATAGLRLAGMTVSRDRERCMARVEVEGATGLRAAESSGPPSDARMRRVVCEAAAHAAALATNISVPDVERAEITGDADSCALVVVAAGDTHRSAGAALIGVDPLRAFALATIQAVAALAAE